MLMHNLVRQVKGMVIEKMYLLYLSTIGKFDKENLPKNERNNIIVLNDEAQRSHYGLYEKVSYEKNDKTNEYETIFKYVIEKYIREALPNTTIV